MLRITLSFFKRYLILRLRIIVLWTSGQSFVEFKHLPSGERFPRAFLVFIDLQEIN